VIRSHQRPLGDVAALVVFAQQLTHGDPKKRAVGFKLSERMEIPAELASQFKFARQKSKVAGTIRGSYFDAKDEY